MILASLMSKEGKQVDLSPEYRCVVLGSFRLQNVDRASSCGETWASIVWWDLQWPGCLHRLRSHKAHLPEPSSLPCVFLPVVLKSFCQEWSLVQKFAFLIKNNNLSFLSIQLSPIITLLFFFFLFNSFFFPTVSPTNYVISTRPGHDWPNDQKNHLKNDLEQPSVWCIWYHSVIFCFSYWTGQLTIVRGCWFHLTSSLFLLFLAM